MSRRRNTPSTPAPRSPKEDGEVGETLSDILARHSVLSPEMASCVQTYNKHSDVLSPEVTAAFTRLVSAALSPMSCKVGRPEAKEGLACITRKQLPRRACVVKRMKVEHAERLAQLAREAALEVQREEVRHGAVVRRRREAVAVRKTRSTRHISNTTKTTWS